MPTIRIAVASTPLTARLPDAIPAAVAAVEEAGRRGARVLCLPETGLPGHRSQAAHVPETTRAEIDDAIAVIAAAARRAELVTIVSAEWPTSAGREIHGVVIAADGSLLGTQAKTQIDPSEEPHYVPGHDRRVFTAAGLTFGIATCHEAFRYPEVSRALALAGAEVIFVPHYVTTDDGSRPQRWCDPSNPYNEKALLCRALENTVYLAVANVACPDQGSITGVISPDGSLLCSVPYGATGVATADIDPARATRLLARRWAPERNVVGAVT